MDFVESSDPAIADQERVDLALHPRIKILAPHQRIERNDGRSPDNPDGFALFWRGRSRALQILAVVCCRRDLLVRNRHRIGLMAGVTNGLETVLRIDISGRE